jgi:hypothetical protein
MTNTSVQGARHAANDETVEQEREASDPNAGLRLQPNDSPKPTHGEVSDESATGNGLIAFNRPLGTEVIFGVGA